MRSFRTYPFAVLALCLLALSFAATGVAQAAEEEKFVLLESLSGLLQPSGSVNPRGLAFDQAHQTLLVADGSGQGSPGEVKLYSAAGVPLGAFNGSEGTTATPQGSLAFEDNLPAGMVVDATGDLYISDGEHDVVDKFRLKGSVPTEGYEYVSQLTGPSGGPGFGLVAGLALDQAGDLYVADPANNRVDEFNPAGGDVAQFATGDHPLIAGPPVGVAVDGKGDLFVHGEADATAELVRGAKGEVLEEKTLPFEPDVVALTSDRAAGAAGSLLVSENGQVRAYDLSAEAFSAFQFSKPRAFRPEPSAIAVRETAGGLTGDVYVEDQEEGSVEVYGTPPPLKPAVSGEAVAAVTSSSAQLSATIEPELRGTHYQFQFGPTQAYGSGALPPAPGAFVPGGQPSALASVTLAGLSAGATYHYRIVATNKEGTTFGPDETFTTYETIEPGLPDGRVWELVSPLDKNGGGVTPKGATQASANGEKITYVAAAAFGDGHGNNLTNQYIASRGATGWETENISPAEESQSYLGTFPYQAFSTDLSRSLMRNGGKNERLPVKNAPIEGTGAPTGYSTFYRRDDETGGFESLLTTPPAMPNSQFWMELEGVTPDLRHVVETSDEPFGPHQEVHFGLNEWSGGALVPVNVGLHGEEVAEPILGSGREDGTDSTHALSDDGGRVFWSVGSDVINKSRVLEDGSEPVFAREGIGSADVRTVQLPPGEFLDASAQTGAKVLLSTGEVFDLDRGLNGERLADLTEGMGGFVGELGASEDLSRIYFLDTAVLPGAHANSFGATPRVGENNLYVYEEGVAPEFVATLMPGGTLAGNGTKASADNADWGAGADSLARPVRTTSDGDTLLFQSRASLTGYDNQPAHPADCHSEGTASGPCNELFVFHENTGELTCVSCNPTGEQPTGDATISPGSNVEKEIRAPRTYYLPRNLSAEGNRVFFETPEPLVEQDTNGASDVYEWEGGHVRLISSGTGASAQFIDASESGSDVFFSTGNQLVPGDTDELTDLYDARVDGGFPAPAQGTVCSGGGCQGAPAPAPLFATPSSLTAAGVGNFPAGLEVPTKPKTAAQLRAEKLAKALKACRAKRGKKRALCEKTAHKRFGPAKKAAAKKRRK